jgi:hypothetical protein
MHGLLSIVLRINSLAPWVDVRIINSIKPYLKGFSFISREASLSIAGFGSTPEEAHPKGISSGLLSQSFRARLGSCASLASAGMRCRASVEPKPRSAGSASLRAPFLLVRFLWACKENELAPNAPLVEKSYDSDRRETLLCLIKPLCKSRISASKDLATVN